MSLHPAVEDALRRGRKRVADRMREEAIARRELYLADLDDHGDTMRATRRVGVARTTVSYWRKHHDEFRRRERLILDRLEVEREVRRWFTCPDGHHWRVKSRIYPTSRCPECGSSGTNEIPEEVYP